jgi:hypothetical protein
VPWKLIHVTGFTGKHEADRNDENLLAAGLFLSADLAEPTGSPWFVSPKVFISYAITFWTLQPGWEPNADKSLGCLCFLFGGIANRGEPKSLHPQFFFQPGLVYRLRVQHAFGREVIVPLFQTGDYC